jgi:hypothetical protein
MTEGDGDAEVVSSVALSIERAGHAGTPESMERR